MKNTSKHPILRWGSALPWAYVILGIILLSIPLRYGSLSSPLLSSGDEALTALRSRGIVDEGRWWTPYWNGSPNLHKPPLYYWMVALGYQIWGVGELAVRLPSVLSYLGLLLLAFFMARRLMDAWAGCLAALLLAASPVLFHQSRLGMMDTLVAFLMFAGGYALWRAPEKPRYLFVWSMACGLSLMTKGLGALPIIPVSLIFLAVTRPRVFASKYFYGALLIGLALPLVWAASHYLCFKQHFLREYLGMEVTANVQHDVWASFLGQRTTRRLWMAWGALAPLVFASPVLLLFLRQPGDARSVFRANGRPITFVYCALVVCLILINLMGRQLYWYVIPCLPSMAILAALAVRAGMQAPGYPVLAGLLLLLGSGALLPGCFDHAPGTRWMAMGSVAIGLVLLGIRRTPRVRFAGVTIVFLAMFFLGMSDKNNRTNLASYGDCRTLHELAETIADDDAVPGRVVLNFRYYPANCLSFYARRNYIHLASFLKRPMQAGEVAWGVFEGDQYLHVRGVAVRLIKQAGDYNLVLLENTSDAAVQPRLE